MQKKPFGKPLTKAEIKPIWQEFLNRFEINNIEIVGYPDYLEYEIGSGRDVLSWWKFHLIRKSDKKEIVLHYHFNNGFDDEGKINSEVIYYSSELLKK